MLNRTVLMATFNHIKTVQVLFADYVQRPLLLINYHNDAVRNNHHQLLTQLKSNHNFAFPYHTHNVSIAPPTVQEIWANAHEMRESLQQFLFANYWSVSSHFVAVHSWSVCCSRRSQKSIKPLILDVWGLSKSLMVIRLKNSSLVLVVIGSIQMLICNRFHEKLANNGKIMTFTRVTAIWCPCVQVDLNLENRDLNRRNLRSMLKISYTACPCLSRFWRNSLLKCVSQPEITKKIRKTLILAFKVIQGHWIWCQSRASVRLPISD